MKKFDVWILLLKMLHNDAGIICRAIITYNQLHFEVAFLAEDAFQALSDIFFVIEGYYDDTYFHCDGSTLEYKTIDNQKT